jgi:hypothetical protein
LVVPEAQAADEERDHESLEPVEEGAMILHKNDNYLPVDTA